MNAPFTPGPWRLSAGDETKIFSVANRHVGTAICGGPSGLRINEAEANARLISAGPELLVAAEILASLDTGRGRTFPTPEQCEVARAAVAKARGQ